MWRCQNCETLNTGEFCIICGEEKAESKELLNKVRKNDVSATDSLSEEISAGMTSTDASGKQSKTDSLSEEISAGMTSTDASGKQSKNVMIIIGAILGIIAVLTAFLIIHSMYANACELMSNGEYMTARDTLSKITYYKD